MPLYWGVRKGPSWWKDDVTANRCTFIFWMVWYGNKALFPRVRCYFGYFKCGFFYPSLQLQHVFSPTVGTMAVDWIGFAYAALLAVGGIVGYTRKGESWYVEVGESLSSLLHFVKKKWWKAWNSCCSEHDCILNPASAARRFAWISLCLSGHCFLFIQLMSLFSVQKAALTFDLQCILCHFISFNRSCVKHNRLSSIKTCFLYRHLGLIWGCTAGRVLFIYFFWPDG